MKTLDLARFQKSRQSIIPAGGHHFTIERPSTLDVVRLSAEGAGLTIENATKYVVGWDLKESDLLPGGDPEPVAFDRAIFSLWLADRADLWEPIVSGVVNAYRAHEEAQEARGNV